MRPTELKKAIPGPFRVLEISGHDLRNKVSAILSASQYLLQDASTLLENDHVSLLKSIEASGSALFRLVNDVLEFSTIQTGELKLKRRRAGVLKLIKEVILQYQSLAKSANAQVDVAVEGRSARIYLDSAKMSAALAKLIAEMTEPSGPGTKIRVRVGAATHDVSVSISLEQSGKSEDSLGSMIRSFQHRTAQPAGNAARTMLRLGITNWLVLAHGGTLRISDADEHALTLTVRLPRA